MRPELLLMTRRRTAAATVLTAFLFAIFVRDLYRVHAKTGWLLLNDGLFLHGWSLIAVNLALYGCYCWLWTSFIYRTKGREQLFMIGWSGFLLSPLKALWPALAIPVRDLEFFGITVSLVAAVSLLLYPSDIPKRP